MALSSTCPKCDNVSFEAVIEQIAGANFWLTFIRCASCGAVVGVIPYYSIEINLDHVQKMLEGVELKLDSCIERLNSLKQ